jgi:pimeloyl-ACP methyl ester carboxylesterase
MSSHRAGFAVTPDGARLYWRAVGEGPAIACCNGVGVSTFFFKYLADAFRGDHTVIVWDYRGHGRSEVPADPSTADLSVPRSAADLGVVLDAAGATSPVVLVGHSMGVQVILEYALAWPGRVRAVVPMFGTFGRPLDTFFDAANARPAFDWVQRLARWGGRRGQRALFPLYAHPLAHEAGHLLGLLDLTRASTHDLADYTEHLTEMDPRVFFRMVEQIADHDVGPRLGDIAAPTLVVAGRRDRFTPLHRSETMASQIPSAELFVVDGTHAAIVEFPDEIHAAMRDFLIRRAPAPSARTGARPRRPRKRRSAISGAAASGAAAPTQPTRPR